MPPSRRRAWAKPAQTTIRSGSVRTPRARARYSASAVRSSGRPRGSPTPKALLGAAVTARRAEVSQSERGKAEASGEEGIRSWTTGRAVLGRAGALRPVGSGAARWATRVPDPWRADSRPSATSSAYASATVLRAMPRSRARLRYGGRRVPGARRPESTASRRACISWARRLPRPESSRCRSVPSTSAAAVAGAGAGSSGCSGRRGAGCGAPAGAGSGRELTHVSGTEMHPTAGRSGL